MKEEGLDKGRRVPYENVLSIIALGGYDGKQGSIRKSTDKCGKVLKRAEKCRKVDRRTDELTD